MADTDIHSEDHLVQAIVPEHPERVLGGDSVYAFNQETFGSTGTLGPQVSATCARRWPGVLAVTA